MWPAGDGFDSLFDNGTVMDILLPESEVGSSSLPTTSYSNQSQVSANMALSTLPDFNNIGASFGINGVQNFGCGFQPEGCHDFGKDCSGFMKDVQQIYPAGTVDTWGIQTTPTPAIEETNVKVGRYSAEERKDRILRYLKKRNTRNFNKTIKYACRKTLADRRTRVRGRFARNSEMSEQKMGMKKKNIPIDQGKEMYYDDAVQVKDDDDWLQEAMENLIYLPYIAG